MNIFSIDVGRRNDKVILLSTLIIAVVVGDYPRALAVIENRNSKLNQAYYSRNSDNRTSNATPSSTSKAIRICEYNVDEMIDSLLLRMRDDVTRRKISGKTSQLTITNAGIVRFDKLQRIGPACAQKKQLEASATSPANRNRTTASGNSRRSGGGNGRATSNRRKVTRKISTTTTGNGKNRQNVTTTTTTMTNKNDFVMIGFEAEMRSVRIEARLVYSILVTEFSGSYVGEFERITMNATLRADMRRRQMVLLDTHIGEVRMTRDDVRFGPIPAWIMNWIRSYMADNRALYERLAGAILQREIARFADFDSLNRIVSGERNVQSPKK